MRQAFQRLGCTAAAATAIVEEQEINSVEELRFLMDADVETLCRNTKRPGGVAAAPAAGANLGHMIRQWAPKNINLAAYWFCHSERISQACQPDVINVHSIRALRDAEDNYEDATPPVIDDKDWLRTMDALREYFRNTYGITKIPLLYVVHEQEAPMDEPEGHWEDPMMQMIDRAPLDPGSWGWGGGGGGGGWGVGAVRHPSYVVDNKLTNSSRNMSHP